MESHVQVLEDGRMKQHMIESLLEDNLLKRKREPEEEGALELSGHRRRNKSGKDQPVSKEAHAQQVEDLTRAKEELDETSQTSNEVEYKLEDTKSVDTNICAEIIAAKKDLKE